MAAGLPVDFLSAFNPPGSSSPSGVLQAFTPSGTASLAQQTPLETPPGFLGSSPLSINGIPLAGFSIPARLSSLGGTQSVAVHQFPGGIRTEQSLGSFPAPLAWQGTFTGTNAFYYASAIDRLRVAGLEVLVTYNNFKLKGIITKFFMVPKNQWWVPYEIALIIIKDLSGNALFNNVSASFEQQIGVLAKQALILSQGAPNGYVLPSELGSLCSILGGLPGFLGQFGGLLANIPPQLRAEIFNGLGYVITATQMFTGGQAPADILNFGASVLPAISALSQVASQGNYPTPVLSYLGSLFSSVSPAISSIAGLNASATTQSAVSDAGGVIGNLSLLMQPQTSMLPVKAVRTINPNLFALASEHYGDASKWNLIANANGLLNPMPTGTYNLAIPPLS